MFSSLTGSFSFGRRSKRSGAVFQIGSFTLNSGVRLPVLGVGGQSPFPAVGWTNLIGESQDDQTLQVTLPFTWYFNNIANTVFFPNSNFFITFGSASSAYNNLSANNPNLNKIFIAAADNSWQRVSRQQTTDYVRLRVEGTAATNGTAGSPNMVYEITFFNPNRTDQFPVFELLVGNQSRIDGISGGAGISGIYSTNSQLTGGRFTTDNRSVFSSTSYVAIANNAAGTLWTVYANHYLSGTGY